MLHFHRSCGFIHAYYDGAFDDVNDAKVTIYRVWFDNNHHANQAKVLISLFTNNQTEIFAILRNLKIIYDNKVTRGYVNINCIMIKIYLQYFYANGNIIYPQYLLLRQKNNQAIPLLYISFQPSLNEKKLKNYKTVFSKKKLSEINNFNFVIN